ncbi:ABC transporter permease [Planosporangium thailandense]|uniref:ABC transporter permease n=1 Tax=Planosporangium thailandense TaxID=765197 RepID=A0ABX0Y7Q6_9ACTN|nr:ABC transporter permease [Planosporangium thailandense]NJC73437.1 ABC transporter permease [Planosporangium thailandense]
MSTTNTSAAPNVAAPTIDPDATIAPPKRSLVSRLHDIGVAPALVLILIVAAVSIYDSSFLSSDNLLALAEQSAILGLLALGQSFVIMTGRIDLSNAVLTSFSAVILAKLLPGQGVLAIAIVLVGSLLIGILQGLVQFQLQVPSFIVTLGALGLWTGLSLTVSHASTILVMQNYETVSWIYGRDYGLPISFLLILALTLVLMAAMRWLRFGRQLRAVGLNERAAALSGIRTRRVVLAAFGLCSLFAGLAGVLQIALLQSASSGSSDSLQLPAIAAVVVGGTSIAGGVGGIGRTLLGVLIITVLRVGLDIVGVPSSAQPIFYGALVIAAITITVDRQRVTSVA